MKYLLKLQRFDMDLKLLEKKLNAKILEHIKDRVVIETNSNDFTKLSEVKEVIQLKLDWTRFKDFKNFREKCLDITKQFSNYNIEVKFLEKTKFSAGEIKKKLNAYFKKAGLEFQEEGDILYIEFKGKNELFFRAGILQKTTKNILNLNFDFTVVLENPGDPNEVSDFLRLCWIFKLPLILLGDSKEMNLILDRAKRITKGIDFDKFKIEIRQELPKNINLIGFTKLAVKNETDLIKVLDKPKLGLVFGNEKYGLSQSLRDKLDLYRLTPSTKKPLRASHALSYVLGLDLAKRL